jgi:heme-degrading monooxygenase HmoA
MEVNRLFNDGALQETQTSDEDKMIVREWRGRAVEATKDRYPAHFKNNVLPSLKEIGGFVGAQLCKHQRGDEIEYLVLTRWSSIDAVKAFAGCNYGNAIAKPEGIEAVISFDHVVRHYEVIAEL